MKKEEQIKLSASKIKTLQSCSWLYYAQYVLKVPQTRNDGASRGVCVHTILEQLINPRHRAHYDFIVKNRCLPTSVQRLLLKHAKKNSVSNTENINMMEDMIYTALSYDFFCSGSSEVQAEQYFRIETKLYLIVGIIDKVAIFPDRLEIYDYKSSKVKFSKEELESNVQALIYSLACFKKYGKIPSVKFLFLRFPNQPLQEFRPFSKKQLEGFELFLEQVSNYLKNFTEETAISDLAALKQERQWLCGRLGCKKDGSQRFICQYRRPTDYFALLGEEQEIISTSFNKKELDKTKGKIIKVHYNGCPHYRHESNEEDDPFNLD